MDVFKTKQEQTAKYTYQKDNKLLDEENRRFSKGNESRNANSNLNYYNRNTVNRRWDGQRGGKFGLYVQVKLMTKLTHV